MSESKERNRRICECVLRALVSDTMSLRHRIECAANTIPAVTEQLYEAADLADRVTSRLDYTIAELPEYTPTEEPSDG